MPRSQLDIEVMPNSKKAWALIAGPVLAFLTYWLMPDQFVNASGETVAFAHAGKACAAVTVLMAVWWFTEALPIAVTAMLPLVLYPILEIATAGATMNCNITPTGRRTSRWVTKLFQARAASSSRHARRITKGALALRAASPRKTR